MRTLVHMSDLHFGRVDEDLLRPLIDVVEAVAPDVVVVSGDLTQRARSAQFQAARIFLDALPKPQIVVPGNHDIPLHNVVGRFLTPLEKYRRYITDDLEPTCIDDEIAIVAVNTARSATIKGGRINAEQMARLQSRLQPLDDSIVKIVVTHHPFDLPASFGASDIVGRAATAMRLFAKCGVDLLLAGHLHSSHAEDTTIRYRLDNYAALGIQAGTATSTRGRGETNSFNVLRIAAPNVTVERYGWSEKTHTFACKDSHTFKRIGHVWQRVLAGAHDEEN
jgi:3',5'-cyclic AMP phosphodiesterase CpdA